MTLDDRPLPDVLVERVLARLGFASRPVPDLDGLTALYGAWCRLVPFDNTRKMIALRTGAAGTLPGAHAGDFLEHWLAHGTGGTCWPSSNALYAVIQAAGFEARRIVASMRDLGVLNHASVKVRIDGRDWLADSSMLLNAPLPLGPDGFIRHDPIWPATVEVRDGTHLVWWRSPPNPDPLPCRMLLDPAPFEAYLDGYARSRERSPFNQRLYARRNRPDALIVLVGGTRHVLTAAGLASQDLTANGIRRCLRDEIGLSAPMVDGWIQSGALAASLEPPDGPPA